MGDKKVVEAMEPVGLVVVGMVKAQWAVVAMAAVVNRRPPAHAARSAVVGLLCAPTAARRTKSI